MIETNSIELGTNEPLLETHLCSFRPRSVAIMHGGVGVVRNADPTPVAQPCKRISDPCPAGQAHYSNACA